MIDRSAIASARQRLTAHPDFLRTTPLMRLSGRSAGLGCAEVWLKLEHLQVGGSFKARGMLNRLLAQPLPDSGVIVASGGNAGIATAAAARSLGTRCEVFVPEVSPEAKRARLRAPGGAGRRGRADLRRGAAGLPGAPARDRRAAHPRLRPARSGGRCRHPGAGDGRAGPAPARQRARERGRRRPDRRHRRLVRGPRPRGRPGTRGGAHAARRAGRGHARGRGGGRHRGRFARRQAHRRHRLAGVAAPCAGVAAGVRRRHPRGAAMAVARTQAGGGAGGGAGHRGPCRAACTAPGPTRPWAWCSAAPTATRPPWPENPGPPGGAGP